MDDTIAEWEELAQDYKKLEATHQSYLNKLKELTASQNACLGHIAHQRRRLKVINKAVKKAETESLKQIKEEALKREAQLQLFEETLPRQSGLYLRIILGNTDVAFLSQEAKFKYKDEYEKFKLVCHIIAFVLLLLNISSSYKIFQIIYLFFLLWYYCTITIRESILRANGSKIKPWWRIHHALSTLASAILLIWPENAAWMSFKGQFFRYNLYNCLLQYLQFRYQSGALYRLRSLGKKDNMDITIEGFHYWMWRGLAFLFPFLFLCYFYQLYNSYVLYVIYNSYPDCTWHVLAICVLMFVFFLGNSITTLMVIPNKIKNRMFLRYKLMPRMVLNVVNGGSSLSKSDNKKD